MKAKTAKRLPNMEKVSPRRAPTPKLGFSTGVSVIVMSVPSWMNIVPGSRVRRYAPVLQRHSTPQAVPWNGPAPALARGAGDRRFALMELVGTLFSEELLLFQISPLGDVEAAQERFLVLRLNAFVIADLGANPLTEGRQPIEPLLAGGSCCGRSRIARASLQSRMIERSLRGVYFRVRMSGCVNVSSSRPVCL
ncbi:hypothetical protein [Afifella marina]|uniref:hypothetical protein n=1 Tax=Afifella marina TaxID=1080 RepID=UPI0011137C61|nr:hypothetical protein [Afifella marina]